MSNISIHPQQSRLCTTTLLWCVEFLRAKNSLWWKRPTNRGASSNDVHHRWWGGGKTKTSQIAKTKHKFQWKLQNRLARKAIETEKKKQGAGPKLACQRDVLQTRETEKHQLWRQKLPHNFDGWTDSEEFYNFPVSACWKADRTILAEKIEKM